MPTPPSSQAPSRRDMLAGMIMCSLLDNRGASIDTAAENQGMRKSEMAACATVEFTDALIAELDRTAPTSSTPSA